eukprot:COSAG04_NODE_597_length_12254_cov_13.866591_4_plen_116_part_00
MHGGILIVSREALGASVPFPRKLSLRVVTGVEHAALEMAQPLAGAPPGLGCSVRADAAPEAIMEALHANGFVVLQLGDLSGPQLSAAFGKLFPSEEVTPIGWCALNLLRAAAPLR